MAGYNYSLASVKSPLNFNAPNLIAVINTRAYKNLNARLQLIPAIFWDFT